MEDLIAADTVGSETLGTDVFKHASLYVGLYGIMDLDIMS